MTPYQVFVLPRALDQAKELPGHMRQRIRRGNPSLGGSSSPFQQQRTGRAGVGARSAATQAGQMASGVRHHRGGKHRRRTGRSKASTV